MSVFWLRTAGLAVLALAAAAAFAAYFQPDMLVGLGNLVLCR